MSINCQQKNNSICIIGERIKLARKSRKLSQTELAEKVDLTQGFIGHIEKGRNQPSVELLARIAIILGCNITWLATGEGDSGLDGKYCADSLDKPLVGQGYSVLSDLEEMLLRIIKEGDETKLAAVRGVLASIDPVEKVRKAG